MVVEVSNPMNNPMHYGRDNLYVKTTDAPDSLPKRVWYSNSEANKLYTEMENDIYTGYKKAKKKKKNTVLKVLLWIAAGCAAVSAVIYRKNIGSFIKNLFKRKPKVTP